MPTTRFNPYRQHQTECQREFVYSQCQYEFWESIFNTLKDNIFCNPLCASTFTRATALVICRNKIHEMLGDHLCRSRLYERSQWRSLLQVVIIARCKGIRAGEQILGAWALCPCLITAPSVSGNQPSKLSMTQFLFLYGYNTDTSALLDCTEIREVPQMEKAA